MHRILSLIIRTEQIYATSALDSFSINAYIEDHRSMRK